MLENPETRFTWSSGFSIPYQITGEGRELLYLPGWSSNVIANRWVYDHARFLDRLCSFARLIVMDRRGVGVADRLPPGSAATLEELVDDVLAVMAASYGRGRPSCSVSRTPASSRCWRPRRIPSASEASSCSGRAVVPAVGGAAMAMGRGCLGRFDPPVRERDEPAGDGGLLRA